MIGIAKAYKNVYGFELLWEYSRFCFSVNECVSISAFVSLISVLVDFASSAVGFNTCALITGVKSYISKIK